MKHQDLRVNGQRLWDHLMAMAEIGATPNGGCNRQALTEEDKIGRDLFVKWCQRAGCTLRVDPIGNLFFRRQGKNEQAAPVMSGSHLDTQPTGGKFDGVYGVLAALEVIETLNDHDIPTDAPLEIVVWTNEEGARFSPAMIGSGVYAGVFPLETALKIQDKQGIALGDALEKIGYAGSTSVKAIPPKAAFEVHIEQGPILEMEQTQIGVVSGVQGTRWYDLIIEGEPVHAGPTPMEARRDPFQGAIRILQQLYDLAAEHAPSARATFGDIKAEPGARNTVPERLIIAVDLRHPKQATLEKMDAAFRRIVEEVCAATLLKGSVREEWNSPAIAFDTKCVEAVREAVTRLNFSHMDIVSGAGHDSVYVSGVAPTGMIFVPCEKGISHNEAENAKLEDLEAGCNVLLHSILKMANRA